ncbi:MAG TPA: Ig-like domain-containing protein [Gemmatimonadaceae bacterium]
MIGSLLLGSAACDDKNITNGVVLAATNLEIVSGSGQTGAVNAQLANPLVVRVRDRNGNLVTNTLVSWTTTDGSLSSATTLTGVDGLTSVTWTLGPTVGQQLATATIAAGQSVTFTATGQ